MNIQEINAEITRLQNLRNDLSRNAVDKLCDSIRSLSWTKDCDAELEIDMNYLKYTIDVRENVPDFLHELYELSRHVVVMENSNKSEIVECFADNYGGINLVANSKNALIEFLKKTRFKSLTYNKEILEVLTFIKENYDS